MSFNRNKRLLKEYKTRTTTVNAAWWDAKARQQREAREKQKEEERARQAKREEIAKAVPWIGDLVQEMVKEKEL